MHQFEYRVYRYCTYSIYLDMGGCGVVPGQARVSGHRTGSQLGVGTRQWPAAPEAVRTRSVLALVELRTLLLCIVNVI